MLTTDEIIKEFELFRGNGAGIESWISQRTPSSILERLAQIGDLHFVSAVESAFDLVS
jgi:hypothetical protein